MTEYYLGIDLGTSSVKGILRGTDGSLLKARQAYSGQTPDSWVSAVKAMLAKLLPQATGAVAAVAFSSQVGTYIVNGQQVIHWQSDIGTQELDYINEHISEEEFLQQIGMLHPRLVSYPLPRLLYIQNRYGADCEVLMPKELLIRELTGQTVTDIYSMRGIAHPEKVQYACEIMEKLGIKIRLPELKRPDDLAGFVTEEASFRYGLDAGTPVYVGCNDFFAGLLGMGICRTGDCFDLSGTSEHIGFISDSLNPLGFVSGSYFGSFCSYGGTKSSGTSCGLGMALFDYTDLSLDEIFQKPPVFLPYLNGERAPIFDEKARGVYFGLNGSTDPTALGYATLEGVVFSLYHIAGTMKMPAPSRLICGGGSADNEILNRLKSTLFDCPVVTVREKDTSALGACMLAMVGKGFCSNLQEAVDICVQHGQQTLPNSEYRQLLLKRFSLYEKLYPSLTAAFEEFDQL